jgi:transcriptional regulator with XRE-family HTH domain
MKTFAELLAKYMNQNAVKTTQLANKIGVERQTVRYWLDGSVLRPKCETVAKCASVLRLTLIEREEFLRAAGCPSENVVPKPQAPQNNPIEKTSDKTQALPIVNTLTVPIVNIPINHPHQFFGRERELKRIFERWRHLPLHHLAVIGPTKSGKTSLLHYVKNIHTATRLREEQGQDCLPSAYQFVFVDFQGAGMCEEERLLTYILKELDLTVPSPCDLFHFTDIMRHELHKPTVLLMDRIDIALQAEALNYQFWWGIRSLVINDLKGRLGLLVASPQLPTELIPKGGDSQPSPFLNIFADVLTLEPFEESEARELLRYSPQPLDEADVEWILENSGRWPALVQMLCDMRLKMSGEGWKEEGLKRIEPYRYLLS